MGGRRIALSATRLIACIFLLLPYFRMINSDVTEDIVHGTLLNAQARLNDTNIGCPNYGFAPAAVDYIRDKWRPYLNEVEAMVYLNCINTIYFGNHIGTYLNGN